MDKGRGTYVALSSLRALKSPSATRGDRLRINPSRWAGCLKNKACGNRWVTVMRVAVESQKNESVSQESYMQRSASNSALSSGVRLKKVTCFKATGHKMETVANLPLPINTSLHSGLMH